MSSTTEEAFGEKRGTIGNPAKAVRPMLARTGSSLGMASMISRNIDKG